MKNESSVSGPLKKAAELLTKNWGLKLLSLLLAVIIYHSLKTEHDGVGADNDRHFIQPGQ